MITLKELSPYLPYKLKVLLKDHFDLEGNNHEFTLKWDNIITIKGDIRKPILRPFSDLTKEIEVNGEKFIPVEVLWGKGKTYVGTACIDSDNGFYPAWKIQHRYFLNHGIDSADYRVIRLLLEWNFDIFNLIERDLAVDVNTLYIENQSYLKNK